MTNSTKRLSYPYLVWISLTILAPMLLVFFYSVIQTGASPLTFQFTFYHFRRALDPLFLGVIWDSFQIAAIATIICLFIGYPAAWAITKIKASRQATILLLFIMPMWINMLLRTYAWITILSRNGILNNLLEWLGLPSQNMLYTTPAVILGMVYNFIPFMILPIYTAILKVDKNLLDAAGDLGANSTKTFRKVILPLTVPGIITGVTMVFLPSMSSFVIPELLGGGQFMMIGNVIERQYLFTGNFNFGSALAMILLVVVFVSVWIMKRVDPTAATGKGAMPW